MLESDDIWQKVRPYMNADDDRLYINLREAYREGIPDKEFSENKFKVLQSYIQFYPKLGEKNSLERLQAFHLGHFGVNRNEYNFSECILENCLNQYFFPYMGII